MHSHELHTCLIYPRSRNNTSSPTETPSWDFPGRPVTKALHFQCKGAEFDPWPGNKDPGYHVVQPKKKKKKKPPPAPFPPTSPESAATLTSNSLDQSCLLLNFMCSHVRNSAYTWVCFSGPTLFERLAETVTCTGGLFPLTAE